MNDISDTTVPVAFFFDYICPFCYIGSHRLERLVERWPVVVQWRFLEIHPDNPPQGRPLADLGYSAEQWAQMNRTLDDLLREDGLPYRSPREFTTNSRRAMALAQTILDQRPEAFHSLHRAIFHAYFVDGLNIGDPEVLQTLAREHGVEDLLEPAWNRQEPLERLLEHVEAARTLGLTGVPTLVVGGRPFSGAVSLETLEAALQREGMQPRSR